jgi:hypothetical protein
MIHSLNVVAAVFFGVKPEEGEKSNPCVWYNGLYSNMKTNDL